MSTQDDADYKEALGTVEHTVDLLSRYGKDSLQELMERCDALSAEVVALREDAERYRWARKQFVWEPWMTNGVKWVLWLVMHDPDISREGLTEDSTAQALDRAIDSARLAEKDKGG